MKDKLRDEALAERVSRLEKLVADHVALLDLLSRKAQASQANAEVVRRKAAEDAAAERVQDAREVSGRTARGGF